MRHHCYVNQRLFPSGAKGRSCQNISPLVANNISLCARLQRVYPATPGSQVTVVCCYEQNAAHTAGAVFTKNHSSMEVHLHTGYDSLADGSLKVSWDKSKAKQEWKTRRQDGRMKEGRTTEKGGRYRKWNQRRVMLGAIFCKHTHFKLSICNR